MFIKLPSIEEILLKIILENCDYSTKEFSFSTRILPPELRFPKEALNNLISKGYVYKEIPVINGYTGYVTDEGITYFIEKEQNISMQILTGEARALIVELIENKDSNLARILAEKFEGLDFKQDMRLRGTIKYLTDNRYLNIPPNGWADNVPYFANLTYEGEHYLEFEESQKAVKLSSVTIHNNGQVNMAYDNATITANQYNGLDTQVLKDLIENIKKEICNLVNNEDIETANDSIEAIEFEFSQPSPKKGIIRTAITGLKAIKGTFEFAAATAALVQFVQSVT